MSEITITVRGEHEVRSAPERAVAHATAAVDGPDRSRVVEALAAVAESVRADVEALRGAGGIVEWNSGQASVWTERPWNADGRQLDPVHHAAVDIEAVFDDFAALSRWLDGISVQDGIRIGHIDWQLTPATRARLEREAAASAVEAAVVRASAYASAVGRSTVVPVEIADVGLLQPDGSGGPPAPLMARAAFSADGGAPAIDLRPGDIVVTAAVEARFLAN